MSKIIRQAFGTNRPGDIFRSLMTFDRMTTKPIIHIVYWLGLGLFFMAGMGFFGIAVGSMIKDHTIWGVLLSFGVLIASWLMVLIGVLIWRAFCEFYMAVLHIADDLRFLRQFQEKLERPLSQPAGETADQPATQAAAEPTVIKSRPDPLRFEVPTSDVPPMAEKETGDVLEDPFFRPRFGKAD